MELKLFGRTIGTLIKKSASVDEPIRLSPFSSLLTGNLEPFDSLITANGRRFGGGCQVIASGIAPVSAIPTTTATLALYNTAEDGGKSIVLERINVCLGSGTAAAGATLFGAVSAGKPASVPSAASNYSSQCLNGRINNTSIARWATAVTMPSGSAWVALGSSFQLAAANVGQGTTIDEFVGKIIVPPGYALGLGILSGAGTSPLYTVSAVWSELELPLV